MLRGWIDRGPALRSLVHKSRTGAALVDRQRAREDMVQEMHFMGGVEELSIVDEMEEDE